MKKITFVKGKLGGWSWIECQRCRYWGDAYTPDDANYARCHNPSSDNYDMMQFPTQGCYEGED